MTGGPAKPWWWAGLKPPAIWWTTRLVNELGGLRITSGKRTRRQNLRIKGATLNGHTDGLTVDAVGTRQAMEVAARQAMVWGARRALIHDAGTGLHLHIEWSS